MYFKFRKSKWYNANLDFEYKVKALKEEFKDIFDKYEYILKPVFEVFFPSLAKLEPQPYYTEQEYRELYKATMRIQKELIQSKDNAEVFKPKVKYNTKKDGTKVRMLVFD